MSQLAGKRALVTGASSGIGACVARELAARGASLVLTARREQLLAEVAESCRAAGATVETLVADLGAPDAAEKLWTAARANDAPVDICINNAGFGYFRRFTDADHRRDTELLQLNITSLVDLSRRFVEHRQGRDGRAYLVNIASIGAYQSVPNFAVYTASKAFVRNFTEALHDELRGTPVSATCICPGGTKTEFHGAAGAGNYGWLANKTMMSAEAVAKITLRAMEKGKRNVIPGFMNKLSCWSVRLVPRRFASWMAGRVLGKPRPEALPSRTSAA